MSAAAELADVDLKHLRHGRQHDGNRQRLGSMSKGRVLGSGVLLKPFLVKLVNPTPETVAANTARRAFQCRLEILVRVSQPGLHELAVSFPTVALWSGQFTQERPVLDKRQRFARADITRITTRSASCSMKRSRSASSRNNRLCSVRQSPTMRQVT